MTSVIPAMLSAGATMVFVTERDSLAGRYASEGILQSNDPLTADPSYVRRPSFYAVQAMARSMAGGDADQPGPASRSRYDRKLTRRVRVVRLARDGVEE